MKTGPSLNSNFMRYSEEIKIFLIEHYTKRLREAVSPEAKSFLRSTLKSLKQKYSA